MRSYRIWSMLALTLVILAAGCEEDEIREYTAPKPDPAFHRQPSSLRLMVGIVKRGGATWFHKFIGPETVVAEQTSAFEQMVAAARYGPESPDKPGDVTWDSLPSGWTETDNTQMSVRAFQVGPEEHPALFTATRLVGDGGPLLENVNRWRRNDFRMAEIGDQDLPDYYRETTVGSQKIIWVEMSGGKPVKR